MLMYLSLLETEDDKKSFQSIYENNYLRMYHIAIGILKHQADAENAVHEAFLSIAENFHKYARLSGSEMTGLCVTITKHKAIDIIRKQKHLSEEDIESLVFLSADSSYEPEKRATKKEDAHKLYELLHQLPEALEVTLVLKYFYGYSNREIAKMLGTSAKNVEMRLYRGKQKMREWLENEK